MLQPLRAVATRAGNESPAWGCNATPSIRRAKQHLLDGGNGAVSDIRDKESLISSCDSALRRHRKLATEEQQEYKNRIGRTAKYFQEKILGQTHGQFSYTS